MNREDEIKEINEIINKLDIIQDDEWLQKEEETEEEYNNRIESIEEEIEEELLEYISDSLLVEQEINEEEAIKEAQEKINNDYKLFIDAFVEKDDGTITLKSEEELAPLGYDTPEEIEKLKEIENNVNNPEQYLEKIKESIKASKDIDSEIDRKMELAKSIITAKKRGETIPGSLNPSLEKDKFEKANEHITNTTALKRIPAIQYEYINNNYIAEKRYNNVVRNVNNIVNRSTSNIRTSTSATTQTVTPVVSTPTPKIVTKKIPERKDIVYTNFAKKLDKGNDLTKQKIKARTELKIIFREIEDKELSKEELEDLNSKIESIKKRYPNTVTDKTLDKLYDTFKVKISTEKVEEQPQNIEIDKQDDENKLQETQQELESGLEKIEATPKIEAKEEQEEVTEIKQEAKKVIDSIASISKTKPEEIKYEPKVEIKAESLTSKTRKKTTNVALGAVQIGGAIGSTIGALKKKSGEKIETLKQKGEEIIQTIAQQQKDIKKKKITKPKRKTGIDEEEKSQVYVISTPIITEHSKDEENKQNKEPENSQAEVISETSSKNTKMSKEELISALDNIDSKYDTNAKQSKGIYGRTISKMISYLEENDDQEIQERLNKEILKIEIDKFETNNDLYIYYPTKTDYLSLYYLYEKYENGVKSADGNRNIIPLNKNKASYYLYLAANSVQSLEKTGKELKYTDVAKNVKDRFEANKEEICYKYLEYIKEKYGLEKLNGIDRLRTEPLFTRELIQASGLNVNTEYLDLALSKELLLRDFNYSRESKFKTKIEELEKDYSKTNLYTLKLLGDTYYEGLKNVSDEDIVKQDKRKATKIFEQIVEKTHDNFGSREEVLTNLLEIYSDNTSPLYDKVKADKIIGEATQKGFNIHLQTREKNKKEHSTYVCSDIHGEYPVYEAIVKKLKDGDKLYILGDVIDRGPDGIKILQDVMKRKEQGQVEFLIGNHELMMLQSLFIGDEKEKQNHKQNWTNESNGGKETLKGFKKLVSKQQNKIKEFLLNSFVYKNINVNSQEIHLVHAKSIQDKEDNDNKTVREMIAENKDGLMSTAVWQRKSDSLLFADPHPESAKPGVFTVIGHSPTSSHRVEYKNNYLDIDCGAAYSDNVALVDLTHGKVKYFNVQHERKNENNKVKAK